MSYSAIKGSNAGIKSVIDRIIISSKNEIMNVSLKNAAFLSSKKVLPKVRDGKSLAAKKLSDYGELTEIDFDYVKEKAKAFAQHIIMYKEQLIDVLLEYESFEVVEDETYRTLDHLLSIEENKEYFITRIGPVTSFLPRNQPLYALTCFVLIPSLMASEVHFRIPNSMRQFFPRLLHTLRIKEFFPNVFVSQKERIKFLKERSALRIDPKTEATLPVTAAVVFTGTSFHAERLRLVFDQRVLFIANGSGHNPVVVSEDAQIDKAVGATLALQLYNQGQDCANPNAILVHKNSFKPFINRLCEELKNVKVGCYRDRSCRVGPISEPKDLERIQKLLVENREWIHPSTPGIIRTSEVIVEPTIICKPLRTGGNFSEVFAPVIFVQEFNNDSELSQYFEHPSYARNAMYISVYGTSGYIENLINRPINGKVLHDDATVLFDTHLHASGIERGTQPYGGYGQAASSLSINGKTISKPTLPQRDIFENLVQPLLSIGGVEKRRNEIDGMNKIATKDVQKILALKNAESKEKGRGTISGKSYVDVLDIIVGDQQRYIEFTPEKVFELLNSPNVEYVATMQPKHIHNVRALCKVLKKKGKMNLEELTHLLYAIPKRVGATPEENKAEQLAFFRNVYRMLFGKDTGPRLPQFLLDVNRKHALTLLNI